MDRVRAALVAAADSRGSAQQPGGWPEWPTAPSEPDPSGPSPAPGHGSSHADHVRPLPSTPSGDCRVRLLTLCPPRTCPLALSSSASVISHLGCADARHPHPAHRRPLDPPRPHLPPHPHPPAPQARHRAQRRGRADQPRERGRRRGRGRARRRRVAMAPDGRRADQDGLRPRQECVPSSLHLFRPPRSRADGLSLSRARAQSGRPSTRPTRSRPRSRCRSSCRSRRRASRPGRSSPTTSRTRPSSSSSAPRSPSSPTGTAWRLRRAAGAASRATSPSPSSTTSTTSSPRCTRSPRRPTSRSASRPSPTRLSASQVRPLPAPSLR